MGQDNDHESSNVFTRWLITGTISIIGLVFLFLVALPGYTSVFFIYILWATNLKNLPADDPGIIYIAGFLTVAFWLVCLAMFIKDSIRLFKSNKQSHSKA